MSKFFRHSTVTVLTYKEDSGYPVDQTEYSVRALGRGRWRVECDDRHAVLRTSELGRLFRPRRYECDCHSSGEAIYAYEEVRVERDTWWRW